MRNLIATGSLAAALALSMLTVPTAADASCSGRKTTGTILGGVGGALLGNAVSGGGGGAIVGGLGGAVVGHEIGRGGCGRSTAYRSSSRTRHQVRRPQTSYYDGSGHRVYR